VKIEIRVFVVMTPCSLDVSERSVTSLFRVEAYISISSPLLIAVALGSGFLLTAATGGSIVPAADDKSRGVDDSCKGKCAVLQEKPDTSPLFPPSILHKPWPFTI
jgi:hypothetical protein